MMRRNLLVVSTIVLYCGCTDAPDETVRFVPPVSTSPGENGAVPFVDVFVGTGDANASGAVQNGRGGSTFPGASLPFGMVQLSPDTSGAAPPGYNYASNEFLGASFTHLSGAGCTAMRDFPLFPLMGTFDPSEEPSATFSHDHEIASPGFYEVTLDNGIRLDLTATARSGFVRFTFLPAVNANVLLIGSSSRDALSVDGFHAAITGNRLVQGHRRNIFFCGSNTAYTIYFAARFDRDFETHGAFAQGTLEPNANEESGMRSGLYLGFDTRSDRVVQVKMGLSYVSEEAALQNLDAEIPGTDESGWDFDAVHSAAIDTWNEQLGRIKVEGGSSDETKTFYTALYHVLLQPSLVSDVNGDAMAFGGGVVNDPKHPRYSEFSGWDTYRSWAQLAALVAPRQTSDMMRSLVTSGAECGALPKWPLANQESSTMVGDPTPALVANAWAFGARDFDTQKALSLMIHSATDPNAACDGKIVRDGAIDYLARGYCPIDGASPPWGPAATTLEYAVADFAIAHFAEQIGDKNTHDTLIGRGRNWQRVFDPNCKVAAGNGCMQPRYSADEQGAPHFMSVALDDGTGFVEGNPAQYTWMVPQDIPGLIGALGGESITEARLDDFFTEVNAGMNLPYFYIGNEPGFNAPWIYPFLGKPWKTQALVRRILREAFSLSPGGLPGNDDLGATSAWLVWGMLGVYPVIPAEGGLVLGSPVFPKVTITLENGQTLVMTADSVTDDKPYVQSIRVQGKDSSSTWLPIESLMNGGTMDFTMGSLPNEAFGAAPGDRPPAFYP